MNDFPENPKTGSYVINGVPYVYNPRDGWQEDRPLPKPRPLAETLCGFMDQTGKMVISPRWDDADPVQNGYIRFKSFDKWNIADRTGMIMLWDCEDAGFENGFIYQKHHELWTVTRVNTLDAIPGEFESIISVGTKTLTFKNKNKISIIDHSGNLLHDDLDFASRWHEDRQIAGKAGKVGILGADGAWLLAPTYSSIRDFKDGFAAFEFDQRWGYLGVDGTVAIPPSFDSADDFSEGFARVCREDRFGYIDKKGATLIPFLWMNPYPSPTDKNAKVAAFQGGYAVTFDPDRKELGYLDTSGKFIAQSEMSAPMGNTFAPSAEPPVFVNGIATGKLKFGNYGIVDKTGKILAKNLIEVGDFSEGMACVRVANPEAQSKLEAKELTPKFDAELSDFWVALNQAMNVDAPGTIEVLKKILSETYPETTRFLDVEIDPSKNLELSVRALQDASEKAHYSTYQPFLALAKVMSKKIVSQELKSLKAQTVMHDFYLKCCAEIRFWLALRWRDAGGESFALKAYLHMPDDLEATNLKTRKIEKIAF